MSDTGARLLIVGGGPKALALAAKTKALAASGYTVPEIVVVDQHGLAAHWSGLHGYTDGRQPLGTPPEKDIGYPYASEWNENAGQIDRWMLQLSWQAFLTRPGAGEGMTFAEWVDRGKPQPTHGQWARYLEWVGDELAIEVTVGRVDELKVEHDRWVVGLEGDAGTIEADGVVITGPGPPKRACPTAPSAQGRIVDGRAFWMQLAEIEPAGISTACVIGAGETAAAVTVALVGALPETAIDVVSAVGTIYSRGESYEENRHFSDPRNWLEWNATHRKEFVRLTDRGVFSLEAKRVLDQARGVHPKAGRVVGLTPHDYGVYVTVEYESKLGGPATQETQSYELVVDAVGFNPCWFVALLSGDARSALAKAVGGEDVVSFELAIREDLSVDGFTPRLHLPMLAGFAQGPGFPNLSSLGRFADRVLKPYCRLPVRAPDAA